MKIIQFIKDNKCHVGYVEGVIVNIIKNFNLSYDLFNEAINSGEKIENLIEKNKSIDTLNYQEIYNSNLLLPPITHKDPSHFYVTGTGLTHLGSADSRNKMHATKEEEMTDSMKMFKIGIEGGKPAKGKVGAQPEWFYKGNGDNISSPTENIYIPEFSLDGSEEPEVVGIYMINDKEEVVKIGYSIGNEFSDHVMEKQNYLYLAHSKLRQCSFGPEINLGKIPVEVKGISKVIRDNKVIWEKEFLSGEKNMSHSIENLEHHHFKYEIFRKPGDLHIHYFGTATLSFSDGIKAKDGDIFEISSDTCVMPLRNKLKIKAKENITFKNLINLN
jgi:hypothetical protein